MGARPQTASGSSSERYRKAGNETFFSEIVACHVSLQLRVKNPFFMESHGECGLAQIGLRRTRRDLADGDLNDARLPRIVAGRDALVGEVRIMCSGSDQSKSWKMIVRKESEYTYNDFLRFRGKPWSTRLTTMAA